MRARDRRRRALRGAPAGHGDQGRTAGGRCLAQCVEAYERHGGNIIAVEEVPPRRDASVWRRRRRRQTTARPSRSPTWWRSRSRGRRPPTSSSPAATSCSRRSSRFLELVEKGAGGEIQLTDGMIELARRAVFPRRAVRRQTYDCGSKLGFLTANLAFALDRQRPRARASRRNCASSASSPSARPNDRDWRGVRFGRRGTRQFSSAARDGRRLMIQSRRAPSCRRSGRSTTSVTGSRRSRRRSGRPARAGSAPRSREAVETIAAARGRVIVTGIGKSGHIAPQDRRDPRLDRRSPPSSSIRPRPATATSAWCRTATSVLALSWSGETTELAAIVTFAKRYAIPLIAMTAERRQRARPRGRRLPHAARCAGGLPQRPRADDLDDDAARARRRAGDRAARGPRLHRARLPRPPSRAASSGAKLRMCGDVMHTGDRVAAHRGRRPDGRGDRRDDVEGLRLRRRLRRRRPARRDHHRRRPAPPPEAGVLARHAGQRAS